jgi:hypothetical protein
MSNSPTKTTTPADFIVLKSYTANDTTTIGEFPIYITGVSECCLDEKGKQKVIPIVIPKK